MTPECMRWGSLVLQTADYDRLSLADQDTLRDQMLQYVALSQVPASLRRLTTGMIERGPAEMADHTIFQNMEPLNWDDPVPAWLSPTPGDDV